MHVVAPQLIPKEPVAAHAIRRRLAVFPRLVVRFDAIPSSRRRTTASTREAPCPIGLRRTSLWSTQHRLGSFVSDSDIQCSCHRIGQYEHLIGLLPDRLRSTMPHTLPQCQVPLVGRACPSDHHLQFLTNRHFISRPLADNRHNRYDLFLISFLEDLGVTRH